MRAALYMRVSTADRQTVENQRRDLRAYCEARGWTDVVEYVDQGVSGTKHRRPGLDRLMAAARGRKIDVVVVAAFDRFARSTRHLIDALDTFEHVGVDFVSLREQIDTASPLGRAVYTIIAAIAELERSLIVERIHAGLRRARAEGKRLGRPVVAVDVGSIHRAVERAGSIRAAARRLGCSEGTLRNRLACAAS